ncbi:hypothetical protein BDA99DRAFT_522225 [Phascolomyces articulosus]|uniref:Uncharacterized protein n=1 Tax=Phascolomyces articulosus TaxID=60185 RepID=A0AAD5JRC0_9FUNG|nr:hypothetical protein BDA99DRAFT_522225 [Phascolomyces articulosus]
MNIRSDVIYIAYPLFDLALDNQYKVKKTLYEQFAEPGDDIKKSFNEEDQMFDNGYDGCTNNNNDTDIESGGDVDSMDEENEGVIDVVLREDSISGLYNGTATVIVRRILPTLMKTTELLKQQRYRHLLSNNVRVFHMYCKECKTLDDHQDGCCD